MWKSSGRLSLADRQVGSSMAYLGRVLSAGSPLSWSQAVPPLGQPGGSRPGGCPSGVCLRPAKTGHGAAVTWHLNSLALDGSRPVEGQGPRLVKGRSLLWTQGPLVLPWAVFLVSKSRSIPEGPRSVPHFWHLTHQGALRLMSLRRHTGPDSRCPRRPPEEFDFDCGGDREAETSLSRSGRGQTRQSQAPHGQALGISFLWPL